MRSKSVPGKALKHVRMIIEAAKRFYEATLPILSDIVGFSFLYMIALFVLALGKDADESWPLYFGSTLFYIFALGFLLSSATRAYRVLSPLLPSSRSLGKLLRSLLRFEMDPLSFTSLLVLTLYMYSMVHASLYLALLYIGVARANTADSQKISTLVNSLSTPLSTLTLTLFLASIISIGAMNAIFSTTHPSQPTPTSKKKDNSLHGTGSGSPEP